VLEEPPGGRRDDAGTRVPGLLVTARRAVATGAHAS